MILSLILAMAIAAPTAENQKAVSTAPPPAFLDVFAQCVVAKHPVEAQQYTLHRFSNWRAEESALRKLRHKACVPSQASPEQANALRGISEDNFKTALALVLVRREFPNFVSSTISEAQPLEYAALVDRLWPKTPCPKCKPEQLQQIEDVRAKMTDAMGPLIFGECAVRSDPKNAHTILTVEPGSSAEMAAWKAMSSALSQCLAPDLKFTASRVVLKGLFALNYYRLAHAPRALAANASK